MKKPYRTSERRGVMPCANCNAKISKSRLKEIESNGGRCPECGSPFAAFVPSKRRRAQPRIRKRFP